ncbi:MAG: prolyl oligopeptidase family serine peptidase [Verrucomicrobia bacterium]|nr:prolyl oligopeptidase family serine peptidase [Verrucomicrobiota bacterium]
MVAQAAIDYPETLKIDHEDDYFGVSVSDPYRWLEEDVRESDRVYEWVEAQNEVTFGYLEKLPGRATIERRITSLWDYEKLGTPFKRAGAYYYFKNDGLQNQHVLYRKPTLDSESEVIFDPNTWSDDGTVALSGLAFSEDGRYVAYGIQESGSDWRSWKIRDLRTVTDLSETLEYLKFTDVSWAPDSSGFFYAKYPDPDQANQFQSLNMEMKVMYHRLGTNQADDVVVYYRPDHPEWGYGLEVTDDGRYLILTAWVGTDAKYRILVKDLRESYAMPVDLIDEFSNDYSFIDNLGSLLYFQTDLDAPRGRVIAIDLQQPDSAHWKEIIPQQREPLTSVNAVNNRLVAQYLKDVVTQVRVFSMAGQPDGEIELPGVGSASGFDGRRGETETFFKFQSIAVPPSIYRYDFVTRETRLLDSATVDFDPGEYVTKQVFYSSKDGTKIPMFITHRKGIELDGSHATLLYGYGGFDISIRPSFSPSRIAWLEMGGIYAIANIRGGGEYGKAWHEAGKKMNKQNVFDDFIAAAEYLNEEGYSRPEKLAIQGGSNGGLLVGACITQRPDLFGAALPAVGVMDMLRFDKFTAGRFWTDDFGSASDSKEMFQYLLDYSPYQNLKDGVNYPATLVTTADTDDRVVPGHSFKFAARLQEAHAGENPVLIRIQTRAGHGSGKPTSMIIEEHTDIYSFLADNLDMTIPPPD